MESFILAFLWLLFKPFPLATIFSILRSSRKLAKSYLSITNQWCEPILFLHLVAWLLERQVMVYLSKCEGITTSVTCSNLQKLMVEIYECTNYISPSVFSEFFATKEIKYDLRIKNLLQVPKVKTSTYGQNSLSFRGSILWNTLSDSTKFAQNTTILKAIIKNLGRKCHCKSVDKLLIR